MASIWLEIDSSEMMANDYIVFMEFLSVYDMQYASYYGDEYKIIMELRGDMEVYGFNTKLSLFMVHQPIIQLDEEPDISDIDLIEEMSNMN